MGERPFEQYDLEATIKVGVEYSKIQNPHFTAVFSTMGSYPPSLNSDQATIAQVRLNEFVGTSFFRWFLLESFLFGKHVHTLTV